MKSQDILLLLKLVSLEFSESQDERNFLGNTFIPQEWRGWLVQDKFQDEVPLEVLRADDRYSVRGLEHATGISKSQISAALRRCYGVSLARPDRKTGRPRVNTKSLWEFISYGIRYVFPARLGALVRGIPTAAFAPVLAGQIISGSDNAMVWPDVEGNAYGQKLEPIYKSVPHAVRNDPYLYALLALMDSIRIGQEREAEFSKILLKKYLGRT